MARLPYPDDESLSPESRNVLAQMPARLHLFSLLAYAPSIIGPTLRLGGAILGRMELAASLRELAILRISAVADVPYEAFHHVPIARAVGLSETAIAAAAGVPAGSGAIPDGLEEPERLVLRLVDETLVAGAGSAEVVGRLVEELGDAALVELVVTVGYYSMIGQVVKTLDADLDEVGLA